MTASGVSIVCTDQKAIPLQLAIHPHQDNSLSQFFNAGVIKQAILILIFSIQVYLGDIQNGRQCTTAERKPFVRTG
ncbi:hypothetical protein Psch_00787 [Pelotomaculum schinkii]|uniref:Uncharacterized protein n=1 Tax=Pelotomaculum schinkii TaxID=78350 RepID=A0A4Y7RER9_9FIRM|nr:hypothetical protein Psch_00787 [Pelotomaculum schinkii]